MVKSRFRCLALCECLVYAESERDAVHVLSNEIEDHVITVGDLVRLEVSRLGPGITVTGAKTE